MINLLSDEKKSEIRAGRANVIIVNYIVILIVATLLLGAVSIGAYVTLNVTRTNAQQRVAENSQSANKFSSVEQRANTFRSNLATAKQILNNEVSYSKLAIKITQAVPAGVVLDQLNLDSKTLGTPTTLNAHAKTKADALLLKQNFEKQTELFSNVRFEKIEIEQDSKSQYPVAVGLGLTIRKEAIK